MVLGSGSLAQRCANVGPGHRQVLSHQITQDRRLTPNRISVGITPFSQTKLDEFVRVSCRPLACSLRGNVGVAHDFPSRLPLGCQGYENPALAVR